MRIGVIGLGYVGLPIALAFSRKFEGTYGFDINETRVEALKRGVDETEESSAEELAESPLTYTTEVEDLKDCTFFVVAVPTPVDENHTPDLTALRAASKTVGQVLKAGDIVVYESTVYPGVTEEICGPLLEEVSGLTCGKDFKLGYSPERINPGDKEHTLEKVVKVVAGQDEESLEIIADTYGAVITAGVHKASSIKVGEAAKVIENTQRDLNIALMNELSIIFDRMDIPTKDVLQAAGTKWNFLKFFPGLVGGHCIGVDPYYLTMASERHGYHPQVILAGRRINDNMGKHIAQRAIKLMVQKGIPVMKARIGIFGITFKENVPDIRNSRVPDIIHELHEFSCKPLVCDLLANSDETYHEYEIALASADEMRDLDVAIVAVAHDEYSENNGQYILDRIKPDGILIDIKSLYEPKSLSQKLTYWSL